MGHGEWTAARAVGTRALRQPNQRVLRPRRSRFFRSPLGVYAHRRTAAPLRFRWLPIVGLCAVGVSLAFPLFLYLRERAMEELPGAVEAVAVSKT